VQDAWFATMDWVSSQGPKQIAWYDGVKDVLKFIIETLLENM